MLRGFLFTLLVVVLPPLTLYAQPSPLTIQPSTGNVGIGTNNPAFRFEMRGGTHFLGDRGDGCCAGFMMNSGAGETHLYSFGSGCFGIHKYGSGSASGEAFSILPTGEVGIGTMTPNAKLSVNGDASKAGTLAWTTYSDRRLKDIRGPTPRGLTKL